MIFKFCEQTILNLTTDTRLLVKVQLRTTFRSVANGHTLFPIFIPGIERNIPGSPRYPYPVEIERIYKILYIEDQ